MQTEPMFPPPKPDAVKGECDVSSSKGETFHVNLDDMTCECQYGPAWRWDSKRWKPNNLCNHKLKAVASLCAHDPENEKLYSYYEEQVGRRNNAFEAVSAMHKEVRRGDVEAALYWATIMVPHRGTHGVITYLRNILFEETRDLSLARYILKVSSQGRSVSLRDMQRAVHRFCLAPKKWELPWRHDIFLNEMRGYKRLATKYGYDVAKPKDIIDFKDSKVLAETLLDGFAEADPVKLQYGLKGWFKSKSTDHDHMKIDILNLLVDVLNGEHPNAFEYDDDYAHDLQKVLMLRIRGNGGVGYHELNALADALSGEPGHDPRATITPTQHKLVVNYPKERRIKLGDMRRTPLYAHDNHTWGGKAKMRSHFAQLRPGAKQTDLDFRMCGAYMGVAWRTLAYRQHGAIDCNWGDVAWKPKWLWEHLDHMWY